MAIYELDSEFFVNLGKTAPYKMTEIIGKDYPDHFLIPGEGKNFLVLNKEKAWLIHADSLVSVTEELEGYLGMSVDDFILISLGAQHHNRFCVEDYDFWKELIEKFRLVYYFD